MADDLARRRLGRGLAALIGDAGGETATPDRRALRRLPVAMLKPNPRNPRKTFDDGDLADLAASIRERGVVQAILVRPVATGEGYEIIAGERRWRAAQRAGLHEVPIVVHEVSDREALELAIIENVQRTDLNAIEEATGYLALMDEYSHTQDEVAKIVGKSRSHVANTVRLLKLPPPIQAYVRAGKLSAGHARLLIGQTNAHDVAEMIITRGLNVRQVEALAREDKQSGDALQLKQQKSKDADTLALEKRVSDALGLVVSVDHRGAKGTLHIHYRDLDQLDEILRRLERHEPAKT